MEYRADPLQFSTSGWKDRRVKNCVQEDFVALVGTKGPHTAEEDQVANTPQLIDVKVMPEGSGKRASRLNFLQGTFENLVPEFSRPARLGWLTSFRKVDSREFCGCGHSLLSDGSS